MSDSAFSGLALAPRPDPQTEVAVPAAPAAVPMRPVPPATLHPIAAPARLRPRHHGLIAGFLLCVLLPLIAAAAYLYGRAADQYASTFAFTIRSEAGIPATDFLGGLGRAIGGSGGGGDADILYEYIRSEQMVRRIDARLNLRGLYGRHRDIDPILTFDPSGTIEDLTDYWRRMVRVALDTSTGLIEVRVLAFTPQDAQAIARAIDQESAARINTLSDTAREDAIRYARADLLLAEARVRQARETLTLFRTGHQFLDPASDAQSQVGRLHQLEGQLAAAQVDFDLLSRNARENDPRMDQARKRIAVIEAHIDAERQKFGAGGDQGYAAVMAEYERLSVDREFAERSHVAAMAAYDAARADAMRKTRYLAAYIEPTLAEKSEFPQREILIALIGLFSFSAWSIATLILYALRDRR